MCLGTVKTSAIPSSSCPRTTWAGRCAKAPWSARMSGGDLLDGAIAFVHRVVERYRQRDCIIAWQVEHEAVDPLGMEHSWRLAEAFVRSEVDAVRAADPAGRS